MFIRMLDDPISFALWSIILMIIVLAYAFIKVKEWIKRKKSPFADGETKTKKNIYNDIITHERKIVNDEKTSN